MNFFYSLLAGLIERLARRAYNWLLDLYKRREEYKGEISENLKQALLVDSLAQEIRQLIKDGKPVPKELEDRLKDESKKLIDGSFDGGNPKPNDGM